MKLPFTIMEHGLEITFERTACLEYYQLSGSMAHPDKNPDKRMWRRMALAGPGL